MENEKKNLEETKNAAKPEKKENKDGKLNLTVIISAAVGAVAIVAIVLAIVLGGGKNNNNKGNNDQGGGDGGSSDVDGGSGILNEDNIDPDGWTKVDK